MKRTQLKDALRNIWKQKISYLSIVVIAALGVTMFLGIDYSASAIRKVGSSFYNDKNYRDIEAVSTLLFSEEDLEAIRSMEGVTDVEGVYATNAKVTANGIRKDVQVLSLTERMNQPVVYDGRLPERADECAVEQRLLDEMGWKIGDRIELRSAKDEPAPYMKQTSVVICGTALHPDHICSSVPETPYIMVTRDAFDEEQLNGCFMKVLVMTEREVDAARYEAALRNRIGEINQKISAIAESRTEIREVEVKEQAKNRIDENRRLLQDGWQKLIDARETLDDGQAELADGEAQYADGEAKLAQSRAQLDDAKRQLEEGKEQLEDSRSQLDDAKAQLEKGEAELKEAEKELADAKAQLVSGWNAIEDVKHSIRIKIREKVEEAFGGDTSGLIKWVPRQRANPDREYPRAIDFPITQGFTFRIGTSLEDKIEAFLSPGQIPDEVLRIVFANLGGEGEYSPEAACALLSERLLAIEGEYGQQYRRLEDACYTWDKGHAAYLEGKAQYEEGQAQYLEALALYTDGETQYAEGLQKYNEALAQYNDGEAQYAQGAKDLEKARLQLEEARQKLADGESEYEDGLRQYEEGQEKLEEAEKQVESLGPCKWISTDTYGNASFVQLGTSANNLKSMEMTFSMLFILVGALVIYATISKMVDEQRTLIGTTKALGFFNREIFLKYLLFGVSATVLGTALGFLIARLWIQRFILNGYNLYFNIDLEQPMMTALPTVVVFAAGILLSVGAIWFASRRLLKQPAIRLMQQAVPKGTTKGSKDAKQGLPLFSRLIVRNIKTDWKRVLVTIVSVAGCCSLVVIGITLRQAVDGAIRAQYEGIIHYDGMVLTDLETNAQVMTTVERELEKADADRLPLYRTYLTVRITDLDIQELYCGDLSAMQNMVTLRHASSGKLIEPTDDGILIAKRFSEVYGLREGDSFEIALNGTETATVRVAAIFDNYMGRALYMSDGCFKQLFGRDPEPNVFLVKLNGTDSETLVRSLRAVEGFESYQASDAFKKLFETATSVMNAVVLLFIFMAAIMAGVVLMNLTNIYIMQKKRELTVMRINGFTVKEVIGYVLRETVVTTVLGVILGIGVGTLIGYRIVLSLEQSFIQFDRSVSFLSWLIGAVMTILFTVIVNVIALRKVRNLKLTDVA